MSTKKSRMNRSRKKNQSKTALKHFKKLLTFIGYAGALKILFYLLALFFDILSKISMGIYEFANFISSCLYYFITRKGNRKLYEFSKLYTVWN
ncbi:hypothetical protein ACS74_12650 [Exiguobacterium acetylicum]|nr:hypothetical protein ACS74_12650 [Exiguobacterium acetylicum]